MSDEKTVEVKESTGGLVGVGGWLAFFLLTMMVFGPLMDLKYLTEHPDQIYKPLVWFLILVQHGIGIYAGILMLQRKAKGVKWAKIRLIVGLSIAALELILTVVGGFMEPKTVESSSIISALRSMIYSAFWLAYLGDSKRVKNTYFPTPLEPAKEA
jgi:Protein of unknown function (DUF2569)